MLASFDMISHTKLKKIIIKKERDSPFGRMGLMTRLVGTAAATPGVGARGIDDGTCCVYCGCC